MEQEGGRLGLGRGVEGGGRCGVLTGKELQQVITVTKLWFREVVISFIEQFAYLNHGTQQIVRA